MDEKATAEETDGETSTDSSRKWLVWAALACITALFLVLRLRYINQLLGWDEAQLALTIRSFSAGTRDVWSSLSHIHPPLYLWLMAFLTKAFGARVIAYKVFSILFSFGTLVVTYAIAKRLFSQGVALLAAFVLAVMPAAVVMDTWVKQDPMVGFLIVLTIYLFVRGSWKWAGVVFGLGMLTKETAIFALMAVFLFSLACWDREKLKQTAFIAGIGFVMSFWWYAWLATGVGHFWSFFWSGAGDGALFKQPVGYYFAGLTKDIGWLLLALLALGLVVCVYRRIRDGKKDYALPVVWFLGVYLFLSISVGKPYWMVPPALPAIAMLCGIGAAGVLGLVPRLVTNPWAERSTKSALVAALVVVTVFSAFSLGYLSYNRARYKTYWDYSAGVKKDALYLKARAGGNPVMVILDEKQINRDAILTYYLGNTKQISLFSNILAKPRELVDQYAITYNSDWIYIKTRPDVKQVDSFLAGLADWVPYKITRNSKWGTAVELTWSN